MYVHNLLKAREDLSSSHQQPPACVSLSPSPSRREVFGKYLLPSPPPFLIYPSCEAENTLQDLSSPLVANWYKLTSSVTFFIA
jgi:hypothetical protein